MVNTFQFAPTPKIIFGAGYFAKLPEIISERGDNILLITGGSSLRESGYYQQLVNSLQKKVLFLDDVRISGEPSPDRIDELSDKYRDKSLDLVVAIGGGSVVDAGKAVSAMLTCEESVMAFLEGVGEGKIHSGEKVPFIAVPTTSGTGSEATKNAVLSRVGKDGFKKSLRHDNFIPDLALVDPELTVNCPSGITAASGMDAISQLLGAYLSTEAFSITDSLILKALELAGNSYLPVCTTEAENVEARAGMAYASLISGIVLANAGLGIVHGLASPVGGFFDIPHGVVCGTLLAEAVKMNIEHLSLENSTDKIYLNKYANAGALLTGKARADNLDIAPDEISDYCRLLIDTLERWTEEVEMPELGEYGITEEDLPRIAENTGNKNNPIKLSNEQIIDLLESRL